MAGMVLVFLVSYGEMGPKRDIDSSYVLLGSRAISLCLVFLKFTCGNL